MRSGLDTFNFDTDKLPMDKCLVEFTPVSEEEIQKVIKSSPDKSCELDPIPTWLLKSCLPELLPLVTKIIIIFFGNWIRTRSIKKFAYKTSVKKARSGSKYVENLQTCIKFALCIKGS